ARAVRLKMVTVFVTDMGDSLVWTGDRNQPLPTHPMHRADQELNTVHNEWQAAGRRPALPDQRNPDHGYGAVMSERRHGSTASATSACRPKSPPTPIVRPWYPPAGPGRCPPGHSLG